MNILTRGIQLILVTALTGSIAFGQERELEFSIGGGLMLSRTLSVKLSESGQFHAIAKGRPLTETGPTTFEAKRTLTKAEASHLFELALAASIEWRGTGERWHDCKGATLKITGGPKDVYTRSGCIADPWLSRPKVQAFVSAINALVPKELTINEVLSN